eukprot:scaffold457445_cov36-Prasinocladus_malaysianus.AAC.1
MVIPAGIYAHQIRHIVDGLRRQWLHRALIRAMSSSASTHSDAWLQNPLRLSVHVYHIIFRHEA